MNKKALILIGGGVLVVGVSLYFLYQQYLKEPVGKGEVSAKTKKNKIVIVR
jgi:hypothetical protein